MDLPVGRAGPATRDIQGIMRLSYGVELKEENSMGRVSGLKILVTILLSIFLTVGVAQSSFASDTMTGFITKIDNTRVTLQNDTEDVVIIVNNPATIKTGDYVKVTYHALADIFIAQDIQVLPQP